MLTCGKYCLFSFCRDSELINTIETLQLNNKRLIEQQNVIQAQVHVHESHVYLWEVETSS